MKARLYEIIIISIGMFLTGNSVVAAPVPACMPTVAYGSLAWPLPPAGDSYWSGGMNVTVEYPDLDTCKAAQISASEYFVPMRPVYRYVWNDTTITSAHHYYHSVDLNVQHTINTNWWGPTDSVGICQESCSLPELPAIKMMLTNTCGLIKGYIYTIPVNATELSTTTYVWADGQTFVYTNSGDVPSDATREISLMFPDGTTKSVAVSYEGERVTLADFGYPDGYIVNGQGATFTATATMVTGKTVSTSSAMQAGQGLTVSVEPSKNITIEPKLPSRKGFAAQNGKNETPVTVTVLDQNGAPANGASVMLSVERASTKYGGHDHDAVIVADSTRPKGTLKAQSGTTDASGLFNTTYVASEFAAEDKIKATASFQGCGGEAFSAPIAAQVQGLVLWLNVPTPHRLTGGTCNHHGPSDRGIDGACTTPDNNHWLTQASSTKLSMLLDAYYAKYPTSGLRPNDGSLPYGGKFDISGTWSGKHKTHRRGTDTDIGIYDINDVNTVSKKKLIKLNDANGGGLFRDIKDESSSNHLHIYFE